MNIHVPDGSSEERAKYSEIWSFDEYREANSPGLINVDRFMSVMQPKPGTSLIDIGCGSGKAGLEFEKRGLQVSWTDITDAGLDKAVKRHRFIEAPLWGFTPLGEWDYGFCCDV